MLHQAHLQSEKDMHASVYKTRIIPLWTYLSECAFCLKHQHFESYSFAIYCNKEF